MEDILMNYYKDESCPVCSEKFKEGDDIVVCPECGTPYHRHCYNKSGKCVYESKHGEYFYSNKKIESIKEALNKKEEEEEKEEVINKTRCKKCGKLLSEEEKVCENCGTKVNENDFKNIILKQKVKKSEKIFGIDVMNWIAYLSLNEMIYLAKFKFMERNGYSLFEFSFCAFWFKELYFIYRKMYLIGGIFFIIRMLIVLTAIVVLLPQDILNSIVDLKAVNFFYSVWGSNIATNLVINKFLMFLNQNSQFLNFMVCSDFVLSMIMGATATRIYKNISVKRIKSINKDNYSKYEDYLADLLKKGSVNYYAVMIVVFILMIAYINI